MQNKLKFPLILTILKWHETKNNLILFLYKTMKIYNKTIKFYSQLNMNFFSDLKLVSQS